MTEREEPGEPHVGHAISCDPAGEELVALDVSLWQPAGLPDGPSALALAITQEGQTELHLLPPRQARRLAWAVGTLLDLGPQRQAAEQVPTH